MRKAKSKTDAEQAESNGKFGNSEGNFAEFLKEGASWSEGIDHDTVENNREIVHNIGNVKNNKFDDIANTIAEAFNLQADYAAQLCRDLEAGNLPRLTTDAAASKLSDWEIARRAKLPQRAVPFAEGKRGEETVLDYFERFWGPYRQSLYIDDIARLGDKTLVATVRTFCFRHGEVADLPPPAIQRDVDERAATPPGSPRYVELDRRIQARERKRNQRAPK